MTVKESHTDVLIVGAGPAGLMMATSLAKCGVNYRIVDKRNTKIFNGQADGLQCRTLEIFDALGFAHRVGRESLDISAISFWNPDEDGNIRRSQGMPFIFPDISRFQPSVLHQGRIERFHLDAMAECGGNPVERGVLPTKLEIDESIVEDRDAYPITVNLRHLTEEEATPQQVGGSPNGTGIEDGIFRSNLAADDTDELLKSSKLNAKANQEEIIKAKYMVGCDGAHSWVRNQLGFKLEGESTDYLWGVVDIIPITDFPDIRTVCTIHSADAGSLLLIPRENKLARLYVQLTTEEKIGEGGTRADRSKINPESILAAAQRILAPYKITYRILTWWTAYQVGQRVGKQFSAFDRVFLAGDAVHTHSPKAGQGMNVSMQDTFNLGWKVANVVKGICDRSILKTYESERRYIAQRLIEFDHKYSRLFSGRPAKSTEDTAGVSMEEFRGIFDQNRMFMTGLAIDYDASVIIAKNGSDVVQDDTADIEASKKTCVTSDQSLAKGINIGRRIQSMLVYNQADATPRYLLELLKGNGRWKLIIFAGDVSESEQRKKLGALGEAINDKGSFFRRFTPTNAPHDSIFELLVVHSASRMETTVFDFAEIFRHFDDMYGYDYSKIFVDDDSTEQGRGKIYEKFGISTKGCTVILRPDQHVAYIGPMEDVDALNTFFNGFMLSPAAVATNGEAHTHTTS